MHTSAQVRQEEMVLCGGTFTPRPTLYERILGGDEVFVSVVEGPSLAKIRMRALFGLHCRFLIAGATAVVVEPSVLKRLEAGAPLNGLTCPELFEESMEIDISFRGASGRDLVEISSGILPPGTALFRRTQATMVFFDFKFPVRFLGPFDPAELVIKGSLHIPLHARWDGWKRFEGVA